MKCYAKYSSGTIQAVKTAKYLRLWLGHRRSFTFHVQEVWVKAKQVVQSLNRLLRTMTGVWASKRRLYSHIVNSILLYGVLVWYRDLRIALRIHGHRGVSAAAKTPLMADSWVKVVKGTSKEEAHCELGVADKVDCFT